MRCPGNVVASTRNPLEIEPYKKIAPSGMVGHPITTRVAHGCKEVVEGRDFEDMMMLEFPSFERGEDLV